ncbi:hypothetical protein [Streptomyces sp. NPDC058751]|uniref:hypothetical protein n=1 Tax=Streptomyces sp. NPDC058751 TaxID=3346623 RepID=UPI0036786292
MDRFALCRALREARVPATSYEIVDCPSPHRAADRYFLDGRAGDWTVGVHERGARQVFERFTEEDAACRWIHDRLLGGEPPATDPAPEEPAGPETDPGALQRQADDDLEAALAELRRGAAGKPGEEPPREPREEPSDTP